MQVYKHSRIHQYAVKVTFSGRILPNYIVIENLRIRVRRRLYTNLCFAVYMSAVQSHHSKICKRMPKCAFVVRVSISPTIAITRILIALSARILQFKSWCRHGKLSAHFAEVMRVTSNDKSIVFNLGTCREYHFKDQGRSRWEPRFSGIKELKRFTPSCGFQSLMVVKGYSKGYQT